MGHACTWIKTNNATCAILRPGGSLAAAGHHSCLISPTPPTASCIYAVAAVI